jgi:hypothetical protein
VKTLTAALVLLAALATADATEDPLTPQAQTLKDAGIRPDDAGLREYLKSLSPSPEVRREIGVLIAQLGSEDFARRDEASRRLTALAGVARADLERASRDQDREVARRAKDLLTEAERREAALVRAALREVTRRKTPGAVPLLLDNARVWEQFDTRQAAERALTAAARPEDAEALRRALGAANEAVRLAAAVALLDQGDRRALPVLGRLLDSEDLPTRNPAGRVLRAVTGQDMGFLAYDPAERRVRAAARWRGWIDEAGPAARLSLPAPAQSPVGKVLLCNYEKSHVVELDEGGRKVWELRYPEAGCCRGRADGHRLLGARRRVDEYDAEGQPVWGLDISGDVLAVRRLPSGHTLVSLVREGEARLEEYRPDKSVCWEASLGEDLGMDVQRLPDGNTLVALKATHRLVEVDRWGKGVWEVEAGGEPDSVQRLKDGHTVVALHYGSKVVEVDRGGKAVWSYPIRHPTHAQRLPDGHTVISNVEKVIEIDAVGKVLWEYKEKGIVHLSAY